MDIDARTLACWAENAWDDAPLGANTLREQFRIMERSAANLFSAGSIGSVSKNSASQSYAGAGFGRFSTAQIQQGYRMLIEIYDWLLIGATRIFNSTGTRHDKFVALYPNFAADPDGAVWDAMIVKLQPIDDYQIDLSYLRLRPTLGYPNPAIW